jgi:hypothetical protein
MSENTSRRPVCISCGEEETPSWGDVTIQWVLVLPELLDTKEFDWSLWESDIGARVPMCTGCIKNLELNGDKKIYCAAMALNIHPEVITTFCSKCPDFMVLPLACSDCLRKTFKKIMKEVLH